MWHMGKQSTASLQWHQIVVVTIALFAFFMSGLVSERVFERMPHLEDEVAYLFQARIFAGGQLVVESPQPTSAYWQPFIVDSQATGHRFAKYTPGWSALLAIGVLLGQTWVINAFFSMLTIALVYRLGREFFSPDVGVITALLTAFSPAALLLNGTLMSHSAGLFLATLFIYAYWRLEQGMKAHLWGIVAGVSLGLLAATRPLTSLGIGLPFIAWSMVRLGDSLLNKTNRHLLALRTMQTLTPLLVLSAFAVLFVSTIPAFNYAATGDPRQNLYELVWDYDRIGFGEGFGRNRHRLEKALNHARFDLSLTVADLFGWQFEPITDEMISHFQVESDTYPGNGYSFVLLPLGLMIGCLGIHSRQFTQRIMLLILWSVIAFLWVWFPYNLNTNVGSLGTVASILNVQPSLVGDETFSWIWIIVMLTWLYLPMLYTIRFRKTPQIRYTWLIFSVMVSVIVVQMLYWIGSQRYSTRYYYEALTMASLLTAIPFAWIIRQISAFLEKRSFNRVSKSNTFATSMVWRGIAYAALLGLCIFTLYHYSTPRIMALYRFNNLSPEIIEQVEAQRVDERPILVIVSGASSGDDRVRWRSYGSLMTVTSPYLDSDIIVARDYGTYREHLIEQHPDRQVIDVFAIGDEGFVQDAFSGQEP